VNEGNITAALSGYVALLAPEVQNSGVVVARAGTVAMAAGEMITLKVDDGGSLASLTTTPSTIATLVENKHAVLAPDGQIILSAVALNKLQAGVIKNSGNLEANSLVNKGGKIYLEGDDITLDRNSKIEAKGPTGGGTVLVGGDWQGSGDLRQSTKVTMEAGATIDASATDNGDGGKVVLWSDIHSTNSETRANGSIKAEAGPHGGDGGKVETSGHYLNVDGIQVSTQSNKGHAGEWLLDPYDITIGTTASGTVFTDTNPGDDSYTSAATSFIKAADISSALANGHVTISTGAVGSAGAGGIIYLNSGISWTSNKTLTLVAAKYITGSGAISIGTNGGLTMDVGLTTNTTSYSGAITGAGNFTKEGLGNLILASTSNAYTGTTTINAGTLVIGSTNVSSGSIGSGDVINNAALKIYRGGTYSLSNNFSGAGTFFYQGTTSGVTNALTLSGNNSFTGGITLSGGCLVLGSASAIGASGNISFANGRLGFSAANVTDYSPRFVMTGNPDIGIDTGGQTVTLATAMTNGTGFFYKYGTGTLILTGNSTYTGRTTVYSGTFQLGNGGTDGSLTTMVLDTSDFANTPSASTIVFNRSGTYSINYGIRGLSTAPGGTNVRFIQSNSSDQITMSGTIESAINLIQEGPGTLILTGSNSYTGQTTINAGTLQVGNGSSTGQLGTGAVTNNSVLKFKRSTALTASSNITGTGELIKESAGTVTLSGTSNFTGKTTLTDGYINLGSASALGNTSEIVFNGGGLQYSASSADYSSVFSTSANQIYKFDTNSRTPTLASNLTSVGGTLTKVGAGTLTLTGDNTYTGLTTVSSGTLKAGSATAFGSGNITVSSFSAIDLNGQTMTSTGGLTLNGTGVSTGGALMNSSVTGATYPGLVTLGSNTTITGGTGTIDLSHIGTISGNSDLTLSGAAGGSITSIIGNGSRTLTKSGAGTWTLSGANTFTGAVTVTAGALRAASNTALGTTAGGVTVANGATLELGGPASPSGIAIGAEALTISDGGAVHNVAGYNTYAGTMTLSGNAAITVDTGTRLNFTATGAPAVTVAANKRLSLYLTDGDLTFGKALTGLSGASYFKTGGGTLTTGGISGLILVTGVYARLYDPTGNDYSSEYGIAPDYTFGFFDAASGGNKIDLALTTGYTGSPTWSGTAPVAGSAVTSYSLTYASGLNVTSNSYLLMGAGSATTWNVTPKTITVTLAPPSTTYNGVRTYTDITNATTYTTTSLYGGDSVTSITKTPSSLGVAQAGNFTITPSAALLSAGASAGNYTFSYPAVTATVAKANLTLSGSKVYDGTTVTAGSRLTASGVNGEAFAVTGSGATGNLSTANVQTNATLASVTGLALGASNGTTLGDANNYNSLSTTGSTFSVSQATATLTATKTYSGDTSLTGSQLAITGVTANGTTETLGYTGTVSLFDANVATANNYVTGSGLTLTNGTGLASNYVLPAYSFGINNSATLSRATASVSASKTYNGDTSLTPGQVTITGVSVGGIAQVLDYTGTAALSNKYVATANKYINTTSMTLADGSTGLASNYELPASSYHATRNTATVNRLALTAAGDIASASSTYGSTLTPGSLTFANAVGSDVVNATIIVNTPTLSSSGKPIVGSYTQTASTVLTGADADNYTYVGRTSATPNYTINALALTGGSIAAGTSTYGSAITPGEVSFSNAINGDQVVTTASVNTSTLSGAGLPIVGTYSQTSSTTLTGTDASNYTLPTGITSAANYSITQKALTLSVPGASRMYDGSTLIYPTGAASIQGLIDSDRVVPSAGNVTGFVDKNVGTNKAVTYTGFTFTGADASNYALSANPASTAEITAKPITVSGITALNREYNGTTTASLNVGTAALATGASTTNDNKVYSADNVSVDVSAAIGAFANGNVGTAKPVAITGLALSGIDADNYIVTDASNATANITPKALTVSSTTVANKTYDGTTTASLSNGTLVGVINADLANVGLTEAGTFANKNAGTAKQVTANDALTGSAASNYSLTQPTGLTADIYKAGLTVSAVDAEKIFGNDNPALTVALSGFVGGETLATSGVTGLGLATTNATINTNPGTAVITPSVGTLAADNYDFTRFVNGALSIKSIGGLNNTEVASFISGSQFAALSGTQLSRFSAAQLQVFSAQQLSSLSASQLMGLTANQTSSLSDGQLLALSPVQVSALKPEQLSAFTPAQISLLTGNSAVTFSVEQVLSLSPSQMAAISPTVVAGMSMAELGALSDAQLQALTPTQIAAIAPVNFAAFTPAQIMAMSIAQVQNLSPEQLATFTPAQIASLNAAELAYFDARQLAAIGIFPKVETPFAAAPVIAPIAIAPTPAAIAIAAPTVESTSTTQEVADATSVSTDKKDSRTAFEAPIPVMTEVAAANVPLAVPAAPALTPSTTATTSTAPEQTAVLTPRALQNLLFAPNTESSPRTGVLAITILNSTQAKPTTAGIAFEQDADTVSLRFTSAPSAPPMTDKVVFTDKLISFMVATPTGEMVEFEGTLVNNRMVIVAPSVAAKRVARTEMSLVLAAAVTSLGKERRIMLANLSGVLLDLR
jgi:autotransporter-associated beta strand protein